MQKKLAAVKTREVGELRGSDLAVMVNIDKADPLAPLGVAIYDAAGELMAYMELDLLTAASFADKFCQKLLEAAKAMQAEENKQEH